MIFELSLQKTVALKLCMENKVDKWIHLFITSLQPVHMHELFGKRFLHVHEHQNDKAD